MDAKKTAAGIAVGTALTFGAVDATQLKEVPLERVEMVATERVEARQIGNVVETTFPWKDQPGLKVKVDLGEPTIAERFADKRNKEVVTEVVDFGDGGFKVDILLNEKPDTNRFCYAIEGHENYDFFYQPPLTPEEIEEGAQRPPEIEGSYAVYHKTLKNHRTGGENYATGKVMHIPRPEVWELHNPTTTRQWAELSYDEKRGELCVTAPQDFLDTAEYPVRIDPTFGYTSAGASSWGFSGFAGSTFAAPGNGEVTQIASHNDSYEHGGTISHALYENGPTSSTITLIDDSNTDFVVNSKTWWSTDVTGSVAGGNDYTLIQWIQGDLYFYYDSAPSSEVIMFRGDGWSDFPNDLTQAEVYPWGPSSGVVSIYATYTVAADPAPAPAGQSVIWFD